MVAGPCVPGFHGPVARVVAPATGGLRIERWVKGAGWTEAPDGAFTFDEFVPGACRPPSHNDAARLGCRLEDFGRHWTEEPATSRDRAKLVGLIKRRAATSNNGPRLRADAPRQVELLVDLDCGKASRPLRSSLDLGRMPAAPKDPTQGLRRADERGSRYKACVTTTHYYPAPVLQEVWNKLTSHG